MPPPILPERPGDVQKAGQREKAEARRHAEDEGVVDDLERLRHLARGHDPRPPDGHLPGDDPEEDGADRGGERIDETLHRPGIAGREDVHDDMPLAPLRGGERKGDADRPQEGDDLVGPPEGGVEDPEDHVARGQKHERQHGRAAQDQEDPAQQVVDLIQSSRHHFSFFRSYFFFSLLDLRDDLGAGKSLGAHLFHVVVDHRLHELPDLRLVGGGELDHLVVVLLLRPGQGLGDVVVHVFARPLRLLDAQIVHRLLHVGGKRVPLLPVHDDGKGDDEEVRVRGEGAVGGVVHVLEDLERRDDPLDDPLLDRLRRLGLGHGDRDAAQVLDDVGAGPGDAQLHPLEVLQRPDGFARHEVRRRAGEQGQDLHLLELLRLVLLDQVEQDEARHAGVREAERQIHRLRDGEAARLVAHREVPDVGRPGDDAVEDVLGRQQRPAGEGVDLHLAVGPLLDLLDPPLHLDAGEGRGRREVRVGERDGRGLHGRRRERGRNGQTQDRQDCLEQSIYFHLSPPFLNCAVKFPKISIFLNEQLRYLAEGILLPQ